MTNNWKWNWNSRDSKYVEKLK